MQFRGLIIFVVCAIAFICGDVHAGSQERSIIASYLFKIPLEDIDDGSDGANYDYNNWGDDPSSSGTCDGYQGGHSGVDFQTYDVAGSATAVRYFYSVSEGTVTDAGTDANHSIGVYDSTIGIDKTVYYLHATTTYVTMGQTIRIGDILGIESDHGNTTGEHVHLEVRDGETSGPACGASTSIDPEDTMMSYLQYDADPVVLWDSLTSAEVASESDMIDSSGNLQAGQWVYFAITTLSSYNRLVVKLADLLTDLDLYVHKDSRPTTVEAATVDSDIYCVPYAGSTNSESCAFDTSGDETWYAGVYAPSVGGPFTIQVFWFGPNGSASSDPLYLIAASSDTGDSDDDGISDDYENSHEGYDAHDPDQNDNGVLDGYEPYTDTDGDGLSDWEEFLYGTSPVSADTDSDGVNDGEEVHHNGTDPNLSDIDSDGDGFSESEGDCNNYNARFYPGAPEVCDGGDDDCDDATPIDPGCDDDTDGDGLSGYGEFYAGTDPTDSDTDGDYLLDGKEINLGYDPLVYTDIITPVINSIMDGDDDSDGDGLSDSDEAAEGSDPNDSSSTACVPPTSGTDWTVTRDCTFFSSKTWSGDLYVQNGAVVTIPNGLSLDMDFSQKKLVIEYGSGVLIEQGGTLH